MARKITRTIVLIIGVSLLFSFCTNKNEKTIVSIIEDVIQQYDTIDFSQYSNLEILIRERGYFRDAIYLSTAPYDSNLLPQGVSTPTEWDCIISNYIGILSIRDDEYTDKTYQKYITDDSIKSIVRDFMKLNLDYLRVDDENNVFLSPPPFSFERFFMLRVSNNITVKENKHIIIRGIGSYTHYKGNWYLSDFYIDKCTLRSQ